jgi:hypothetical protein
MITLAAFRLVGVPGFEPGISRCRARSWCPEWCLTCYSLRMVAGSDQGGAGWLLHTTATDPGHARTWPSLRLAPAESSSRLAGQGLRLRQQATRRRCTLARDLARLKDRSPGGWPRLQTPRAVADVGGRCPRGRAGHHRPGRDNRDRVLGEVAAHADVEGDLRVPSPGRLRRSWRGQVRGAPGHRPAVRQCRVQYRRRPHRGHQAGPSPPASPPATQGTDPRRLRRRHP